MIDMQSTIATALRKAYRAMEDMLVVCEGFEVTGSALVGDLALRPINPRYATILEIARAYPNA